MTLPAPPSSHPPVIVMSHPEGAYTTCRTSSEGGKCWIAESTQALCIDCGVCLVASQPTRGRSPSRLQYDIEPCQLPCPRSLGRPSQRTAGALLESAQAEHQVRACVPRLPPQGLVLSLSFARHIVVIKLWAIEDRPPKQFALDTNGCTSGSGPYHSHSHTLSTYQSWRWGGTTTGTTTLPDLLCALSGNSAASADFGQFLYVAFG